eukprot:3517632-Prymnesium_polylepis.1
MTLISAAPIPARTILVSVFCPATTARVARGAARVSRGLRPVGAASGYSALSATEAQGAP